ncbi:MAG: DNA repair protein RecN [Pseudomonadota bacterium]
MLSALAIRDIVLIETLDLDFEPGLNVLTGETGAGKSILLDALGFALGGRPARDLVRAGAGKGSVTATFEPGPRHPVQALLDDLDLDASDGELILRRTASEDGPSRAFVNDQRVSAEVLSRIGTLLVEVHGQHDDRGLLAARGHRGMLDAFGGHASERAAVRVAWTEWQGAVKALDAARAQLEKAAADADYLRHAVEELEALAPQPGEDAELESERRLIRHAAELKGEINQALSALGGDGAEGALSGALSRLMHIAERAEGRLEETIAGIDRTLAELAEAEAALRLADEAMTVDPGRLDDVEERLFAIRRLARKHDVSADGLADHARSLAADLSSIDAGEATIGALQDATSAAEAAYTRAAAALGAARRTAATQLDAAVTEELAPLKMENARFVTEITEGDPGPEGAEDVRFTAAINPGARPGPIDRIASGGELSRFLLALKVQLANRSDGLSLIFDEIDRGVGGATADAVGRRLSRLAEAGQVLVVTHSPQVAALGQRHFQIAKSLVAGAARTDVTPLSQVARRDEIARMLSGDAVTDAARAAADALIEQAS